MDKLRGWESTERQTGDNYKYPAVSLHHHHNHRGQTETDHVSDESVFS